MEYLFNLDLRHFILSQGNGDFEEKSVKIEIITPLINTITGWPWKKHFGLNHHYLNALSMFFLNEESKFVLNSAE